MKTILVSAVALIDIDSRVLIAQRPEGKSMAGLWEFPGGKIEPGETPEAALIRDLLMPLFACRKWDGIPTSQEGQTLKWVKASELKDYPMPAADIPLIPILRDWL